MPGEIITDMFREFYEDYLVSVKDKTDTMIQYDNKTNNTSELSASKILKDIRVIIKSNNLKKNSNY